MNYRPITDVWILGRCKHGYYGGYPAGFLHRAVQLLGVGANAYVLHVCAGKVRQYPYRGLGPNHRTLDLNPKTKPDFLRDAREPFPQCLVDNDRAGFTSRSWDAVLIDRPYSEEDADKYIKEGLVEGRAVLPPVNLLLKNAIAVVPVGGKVGILDYKWPRPPKNATEVALVGVGIGRDSNARWFTVFERTA